MTANPESQHEVKYALRTYDFDARDGYSRPCWRCWYTVFCQFPYRSAKGKKDVVCPAPSNGTADQGSARYTLATSHPRGWEPNQRRLAWRQTSTPPFGAVRNTRPLGQQPKAVHFFKIILRLPLKFPPPIVIPSLAHCSSPPATGFLFCGPPGRCRRRGRLARCPDVFAKYLLFY